MIYALCSAALQSNGIGASEDSCRWFAYTHEAGSGTMINALATLFLMGCQDEWRSITLSFSSYRSCIREENGC